MADAQIPTVRWAAAARALSRRVTAAAEDRLRRRFTDGTAATHAQPAADLRGRMSHAVRQATATDVDEGEQVSLAALLGAEEQSPHAQR